MHHAYRFEAGEEATEGRVAERLPPPTNDAAPDVNGNKIEINPKPDEADAKPEPMDATDVPQNVATEARQGGGSALPAPVDVQGAAATLPPGAVAPIQFGGLPAAAADAATGVPSGAEPPLGQAAATAVAAISPATGVQSVGSVPVVAPGSVLPPAVPVQGQPGAPVAQAADPHHPPFAGGQAAAVAPQSEAPQAPVSGKEPDSAV